VKQRAEYIPYINPARETARALRETARYEANQQAGICSDSMRDMLGLSDFEYCYFLRMGELMPKKNEESKAPPLPDLMDGDPSIHEINQNLEKYENKQIREKDQDE